MRKCERVRKSMRKYLGIKKDVQKSCSKQKLQKEPIFVVGGGV
jgi:hypothetical protein